MTLKVYDKPLVTEDERAREKLDGVKGFKDGQPAPLTKQEEKQTFANNDPGHVA